MLIFSSEAPPHQPVTAGQSVEFESIERFVQICHDIIELEFIEFCTGLVIAEGDHTHQPFHCLHPAIRARVELRPITPNSAIWHPLHLSWCNG